MGLARHAVLPGVSSSNYDVTLDGQRFLVVRYDDRVAAKRIVVKLNWAEELKGKILNNVAARRRND